MQTVYLVLLGTPSAFLCRIVPQHLNELTFFFSISFFKSCGLYTSYCLPIWLFIRYFISRPLGCLILLVKTSLSTSFFLSRPLVCLLVPSCQHLWLVYHLLLVKTAELFTGYFRVKNFGLSTCLLFLAKTFGLSSGCFLVKSSGFSICYFL
jgi:hypothetical protein